MLAFQATEPTHPTRSASAARALLLVLSHSALASCASSSAPPAPAQGPQFVVDSPSDGATVSGATFFSVQPFNPAEVQSVTFAAGGAQLLPDTPGEDAFKVFLNPRDFPEGPLTLRATVAGKSGGTSEKTLTVHVLAHPPSTATVTSDGAVLGTTEESGSVSTLTVPGGAAEGASVTFTARNKAAVKAATGIDYDALGVTFLGAQEIGSSKALAGPLGVSSGGFGPMVQPGQAVLNYLIVPDEDGDGVGELVAVNGASVAPGGEVISNPVPQIQLGTTAAASGGLRDGAARLLSASPLGGPPGKYLEIAATGFNQTSQLGNRAEFQSQVDGTQASVPAFVVSPPGASPALGFYIPALPPGAATVTLRNVSAGTTAGPLAVTIEAPPVLAKAPAAIIDDAFAQAISTLSPDPALQDLVARLQSLKSSFAALGSNPTSTDAKVLEQFAVFIANSNMAALLAQIAANRGTSATALLAEGLQGAQALCPLSSSSYFLGLLLYSDLIAATATGLAVLITAASLTITAPLGLALLTLGALGGASFGLGLAGLLACTTPPNAPTCSLPPSLDGLLTTPPLPPASGLIRAAAAPLNPITGMGSIVPPGGDGCGSVAGAGAPASGALRGPAFQAQAASPANPLGDPTGRFVVKVFFGAGKSVPFAGVTDSSGYFYVPTIPAGQPFEAIAIDTVTKATRSVTGVGPEVGRSTYFAFDFSTGSNSTANTIDYGSNTSGTYGDVDLYFFQGHAGDVVDLAAFSDASPLGAITYQLSDPSGRPMTSGSTSGGHFFELGFDQFLFELPSDGLYSFSLDGSQNQGSYTLGLSSMAPVVVDAKSPVSGEIKTIGERRFYQFSGHAGDSLTLTLSAPVLNAKLQVRGPQAGAPFYRQLPVLLKLFTFDTTRTSTATITLAADGDHVIEVKHEDNPFEADMQRYLGTFQLDISRTP